MAVFMDSDIKALPLALHPWLVDRRPIRARVAGQGPLDLIICVESITGLVRSGAPVHRDAGPEAVCDVLRTAALEPSLSCSPARPSVVQVAQLRELEALRSWLQPAGVRVDCLESAAGLLQDVYRQLDEGLRPTRPFTYLRSGGDPELVAELYRAAHRFLQQRPWEVVEDWQLLKIEGLRKASILVSVLGAAGVEYGLSIFLTRKAARAFVIEEEASSPVLQSQPVLTLVFVDPKDVGGMAEEAELYGWECPPDGRLPMLARFDRADPTPRAEEIRLALSVLKCVESLQRGDKQWPAGVSRVTWPISL